jgi:hypothetical protein
VADWINSACVVSGNGWEMGCFGVTPEMIFKTGCTRHPFKALTRSFLVALDFRDTVYFQEHEWISQDLQSFLQTFYCSLVREVM